LVLSVFFHKQLADILPVENFAQSFIQRKPFVKEKKDDKRDSCCPRRLQKPLMLAKHEASEHVERKNQY
jgi:hypothetical protein